VGWFGRKPKVAVEEIPLLLYARATEQVEQSLAARGHDVLNDPVLHERVGKFVAPASNVSQERARDLAAHPDKFNATVRSIAATAETEFLHDLASKPPPHRDAVRADRYGTNWKAVESFIYSIVSISATDWQGIAGGALSLMGGPPHPAKERMRNLKAQAQYQGGKKARELDLDDQVALAQADVIEVIHRACEEDPQSPFQQACRDLGVSGSQAIGPVRRESTSTAMALVVGSENLETQFYAALSAAFTKQILGAQAYEQAKREFREASEELGNS
jgi:hypothetical protein